MSRSTVMVSMAFALAISGCRKLAEIAGVPNRDVVSITLHVPQGLLVGDTVQASAEPRSADGRPPWGDTTVTWRSSDATVLSVDAGGRLIGMAPGQATVTAQVAKVTASAAVVVNEDQRLGYALADQPAAAGPYSPDAAYRFNSSGGEVTVSRTSAGTYAVRFAGLGRQPGERDNVQVTAYGSPAGTHCKLLTWSADGTDLTVSVHCHAPGLEGAPADSRFTILASGAHAYDRSSEFGFAELVSDTSANLVQDTLATSFNSITGDIRVGRPGRGIYNFQFPGFEGLTAPVSFQATSESPLAARCRVSNYDLAAGVLQAGCNRADGEHTDSRVSILWLTRGRAAHRYGFASSKYVPSQPEYTPDPTFAFNSSGGAITGRRIAPGRQTIVFAGLGRPPGATEVVIVSAFVGADHSCSVESWGASGQDDLAATVACFDASGAAVDLPFNVLVIE
jgi:Bacterial Ig-like domain (group 2)